MGDPNLAHCGCGFYRGDVDPSCPESRYAEIPVALLAALGVVPGAGMPFWFTGSPACREEESPPKKWQSALIGSTFVVSVYALGWALAFTLLPYFGQNPHPAAILGVTYLTPLLVSWVILRIPCIFSWGKAQPVKRLLCSFGVGLISMNIAYAVLFPLTMILNQLLTTIPGSFNPFYWAILSLISVINLLAQIPIHYWMIRRGIEPVRFRGSVDRDQPDIPTIKNAWPVLAISMIIVIGALAVTIHQMS